MSERGEAMERAIDKIEDLQVEKERLRSIAAGLAEALSRWTYHIDPEPEHDEECPVCNAYRAWQAAQFDGSGAGGSMEP